MNIFSKRNLLIVWIVCIALWAVSGSTICRGGQFIDVYILAGQSNAVGYNDIDTYTPGPFPSEYQHQSDVMFWAGSNATNGYRNVWTDLQVGASGINGGDAFGPEIGFGHDMADAYPDRQIAILKYAVGSTGIARSQDYPSDTYVPGYENYNDHNNNWHPPEAGKPTGNHYQTLLNNVTNALNVLENQGKNYRIAGLLWMQGEHEAGINSTMAADYDELLTGLIAGLRRDLGVDNLPVVVGQITEVWNFDNIVRPAQQNVCDADPYAEMVVTKDLLPQEVHYTANNMLTVGSRFATAMQTLHAPEPGTITLLGMMGLALLGFGWLRRKRRR